MLRTPAPEETQNQTDNSHSFSLKWNLAYVIISDPTLQRKRCPRSQKSGEGAEMKPNPSRKGRLLRGWGTWYVAVADKEGTFLMSVFPVFSDEGTTAETVVKAPEAGLRAAQRKAPQELSISTRSDSSTGDRGVDLSRSLWTRRHHGPLSPRFWADLQMTAQVASS